MVCSSPRGRISDISGAAGGRRFSPIEHPWVRSLERGTDAGTTGMVVCVAHSVAVKGTGTLPLDSLPELRIFRNPSMSALVLFYVVPSPCGGSSGQRVRSRASASLSTVAKVNPRSAFMNRCTASTETPASFAVA